MTGEIVCRATDIECAYKAFLYDVHGVVVTALATLPPELDETATPEQLNDRADTIRECLKLDSECDKSFCNIALACVSAFAGKAELFKETPGANK